MTLMQELPKELKDSAILIPHKEDYLNVAFKQVRASEHVNRNREIRSRNRRLKAETERNN